MGCFIFNSSIGRKLIMSITGIALVLFLTFHAIMNIFVIISPAVYDQICEFLGANWYALVGTAGLAALVVIHICYAFWLTLQNYIARGKDRYAVSEKAPGVDWAAQNMLVLGIIVLGFLGLHLYNFWYEMQLPEIMGKEPAVGSKIVKGLFQSPVYCILYVVWFCAIWFHLTHGIWSAIQTLGGSNHIWLPRIKMIANIYATILMLLFLSIPVYYLITNLLG
jgi:succinate dehydrogenase / fumarate reductase, cytochrome b subunit